MGCLTIRFIAWKRIRKCLVDMNFFDTYKKMIGTVEEMAKLSDPNYYVARMEGFIEGFLQDLPRTPENLAWMERVIKTAEKNIEIGKKLFGEDK